MSTSLEFLLGLLERDDPVFVVQEDLDGAQGDAIRTWQGLGFVATAPVAHPIPSCPCGDGVPVRLGDRLFCSSCNSRVDPRQLLAWPLDRRAFLHWLAEGLGLKGMPQRHGQGLWQLGTWAAKGEACECFFQRGPESEQGRARLDAYRNAVVLYGLCGPSEAERRRHRSISLFQVLRSDDGALAVADLRRMLRPRGDVRFDRHSGILWLDDDWLGEIPPGSREYCLLDCLARHLDHYVPYADLKRFVLGQSGSMDATDEATFCQGLKSRIKKRWIPKIDLVIATTNKADGYRLRGYVEL